MNSRVKMLKEALRRRQCLKEASGKGEPIGDEELLGRQIEELEQALGALAHLWDQHQLHWSAHRAELRRRLVHDCAYIMIAFDTEDTRQPDHYVLKPDVLELLHWWREEGGRERYLGELPIEERRELERVEREWRGQEPS